MMTAPTAASRSRSRAGTRAESVRFWSTYDLQIDREFSAKSLKIVLTACVKPGLSGSFRAPGGQISAITAPAAALNATTTSGGARHATSKTKLTIAMPKSFPVWTVVAQTGS